jgi:hypothetical protein
MPCLRRLGVPFIGIRGLGAVGSNPGRQILPSVGWHTGQSGAPPDTVRCPISFQKWRSRPLQSWSCWRTGHCLVHTRQSGAPIWPLAPPRVTRGLRGRPLAQSTVGSPDSPVHHRTVRWIIAVRRQTSPERGLFTGVQPVAPDTVRCTTGQSGAPDWAESWLYTAKPFAHLSFSSSFCF